MVSLKLTCTENGHQIMVSQGSSAVPDWRILRVCMTEDHDYPNTFSLALFVYTTLSRLNWVITTIDNALSWMDGNYMIGSLGGEWSSASLWHHHHYILYSDILHLRWLHFHNKQPPECFTLCTLVAAFSTMLQNSSSLDTVVNHTLGNSLSLCRCSL